MGSEAVTVSLHSLRKNIDLSWCWECQTFPQGVSSDCGAEQTCRGLCSLPQQVAPFQSASTEGLSSRLFFSCPMNLLSKSCQEVWLCAGWGVSSPGKTSDAFISPECLGPIYFVVDIDPAHCWVLGKIAYLAGVWPGCCWGVEPREDWALFQPLTIPLLLHHPGRVSLSWATNTVKSFVCTHWRVATYVCLVSAHNHARRPACFMIWGSSEANVRCLRLLTRGDDSSGGGGKNWGPGPA